MNDTSTMNEMCENCKYRISAEKNKSPDLGEMLKLAMMVSKLFNQVTPARQQDTQPKEKREEQKSIAGTGMVVQNVDQLIEDKKIRIIKSALPYLDPELQPVIHLIAKTLEIRNILKSDFYKARAQTLGSLEDRSLGMLNAIKPHLEPDERYKVEIASKALEMIKIMRSLENIKSNVSRNSAASEKEGLISPEQK